MTPYSPLLPQNELYGLAINIFLGIVVTYACIFINLFPIIRSVSYTHLMGMTISKNTLRNWLKKGKKYLDELVRVLKKGETHKMITFCTSTAFAGCDFYSTNASTFVISDCKRINTCLLYTSHLINEPFVTLIPM